MLNELINTLRKWQEEAENKAVGLKEPAAYQKVIDEINRMTAGNKPPVDEQIKRRIEADLPEKGIHCATCRDCLCYTCRRDDYNPSIERFGDDCCKKHGWESCPIGKCTDYVPEEGEENVIHGSN